MKGKHAVFNFRRTDLDAFLFDLDGVITKTAQLHAASWKTLFDEYLKDRPESPVEERRPFDVISDYLNYVDGKPRYEGVKSFLASRNIYLPYGNSEDPPESDTVCGLGNRKNLYFNELLKERGVEVHKGARELLELLKEQGFRTGVVTSSKNCSTVLEAAGLKDLFDVQVDGLFSARLGLKGKPFPDSFLEAARLLETAPSRTAVFEDALAGVKAGRSGNFAIVIGVDRSSQGKALLENGADLVVTDLSLLSVEDHMPVLKSPVGTIPDVLENIDIILEEIRAEQLFVSLDYDGTLTPIVERPDMAILPSGMRSVLNRLAHRYTVAIISGRDVKDIKDFIQLDNIIYAGSHGFDIASPPGLDLRVGLGNEYLPVLDKVEKLVESELNKIEGTLLERKKYSLAIHYRLVDPEHVKDVEALVDRTLQKEPKLKKGLGKMVFELKPDIEWDKGQALLWLIKRLGMSPGQVLPIYIGDDITDEDAFRVLQELGIGIVVREGEEDRGTMAEYSLATTLDVETFLERLCELPLEGGRS